MKSAMAAADRNLLFGIHAIQMGFISHDAFIAAANTWTLEKHKPIGQILVEQGTLTPDVRDALEQMISLRVRQSGGDVRKSLETLSSVADLAEPLAAIGDTELNRSVSIVLDAIAPAAKTTPVTPGPDSPLRGPIISDPDDSDPNDTRNVFPTPEPRKGDVIGRFRIIRLIGKGGQGAVYEAHDLSELDRTVALKTTLESQFDSPETLQRRRTHLLREGRLNARLEHQFIIPVHGLGTTEAGRPFYAMRLLNQINLDTAINNFHTGKDLLHDPKATAKSRPKPVDNPDPAPTLPAGAQPHDGPTEIILGQAPVQPIPPLVPEKTDVSESGHRQESPLPVRLDKLEGQRNLDFRNLLERFTDICEAMHFAHTRRVLHRDLKPGNIMIGPNGETLVIDWGMAKTKAELQAEALKDRPAEGPESISAEIDDQYRMSVEGRFIGTLGFAAPEQLEGNLTKLNESTDVYSLGMILFEILTGRNPFYTDEFRSTPRDRRVGYMLAKSRETAPAPLAFNPFIPKPLAAICRKALSPDQKDRYATAAELSTDVANWLADERLTAYRDSVRERIQRWTRKNRGKASAIVATFAFLAFGSVVTTLFQSKYKRDVISERDRAIASERSERKQRELSEAYSTQSERDKRRALENLSLAEAALYSSKLLLAKNAFAENHTSLAWTHLADCSWTLRGWEYEYLCRIFDESQKTIYAHNDHVSCVTCSPDGNHLLTCGTDNSAKLWDAATGRLIISFEGHDQSVSSIAFSPDGNYVLTGSDDRTAKLWDATNGREIFTFKGHDRSVTSVAFSPDGTHLLTGSDDRTAKLWDASDGREILTLMGHKGSVSSVAYSPDGIRVLTGSDDKTAKLWDGVTGRQLITYSGHESSISSVAFRPDGTHILTGSYDRTAKLWDVDTGIEKLTLTGHSDAVECVAFSPDSAWIITGSNDNTSKIWNTFTGRETITLKGHKARVKSVVFTPDGNRVITGSWDSTTKLWKYPIPKKSGRFNIARLSHF